jgi:hypothetical protein
MESYRGTRSLLYRGRPLASSCLQATHTQHFTLLNFPVLTFPLSILYGAPNGNLEMKIYFSKAKRGYAIRKIEKDKCILYI